MAAKIELIAHRGGIGDSGIYNLLGDAALKLASPEIAIVGDVNGDGRVDILDLVMVGSHFGERISPFVHPNPDVNGDGVVNILDLVLVGRHFGEAAGEVMAAPQHNAGGEAVAVKLEPVALADNFVAVDIKVRGARELIGMQWNLNFDPSQLEVLSVAEGNFLCQDGEIGYWCHPQFDTQNGRILSTAATRLAKQGVYGKGVLATVYFRIKTLDDFNPLKHLRLTHVKAASATGLLEVHIDNISNIGE